MILNPFKLKILTPRLEILMFQFIYIKKKKKTAKITTLLILKQEVATISTIKMKAYTFKPLITTSILNRKKKVWILFFPLTGQNFLILIKILYFFIFILTICKIPLYYIIYIYIYKYLQKQLQYPIHEI